MDERRVEAWKAFGLLLLMGAVMVASILWFAYTLRDQDDLPAVVPRTDR